MPNKPPVKTVDQFEEEAGKRIVNAVRAIRRIKQMANPKAWPFNASHVPQIAGALMKELQGLQDAYKAALEGKPTATAETFTFTKGK